MQAARLQNGLGTLGPGCQAVPLELIYRWPLHAIDHVNVNRNVLQAQAETERLDRREKVMMRIWPLQRSRSCGPGGRTNHHSDLPVPDGLLVSASPSGLATMSYLLESVHFGPPASSSSVNSYAHFTRIFRVAFPAVNLPPGKRAKTAGIARRGIATSIKVAAARYP